MSKQPHLLLAVLCLFLNFNLRAQTYVGSLTINNQGQLDAIANAYTEITGTLQLSGSSINDLSPLDNLEKIGGDLRFNSTFSALLGPTALSSLDSIGGTLSFNSVFNLGSVEGMANLSYVGGDVSFSSAFSLTNIDGFNNLLEVGGDIKFSGMFNLASLGGFNGLVVFDGAIDIGFCFTPFTFTGFSSLPQAGSIDFGTSSGVTEISGFNNLISITNDLDINSNNLLVSISGFESLQTVGGFLKISSASKLETITGFTNLESVDGDFRINSCSQLATITGFYNLTSLGNSLEITSCELFPTFEMFSQITEIPGSLGSFNVGVQSLNGFQNITSVGLQIYFQNMPNITNIDELAMITSAGSSITFSSNPLLENINGIGNITSFTEAPRVAIISNPVLSSIDPLNILTGVVTSLGIARNNMIPDLNALSGITTVVRGLSIQEAQITSLNGLHNITAIGGNLSIRDCTNLLSTTALSNVDLEPTLPLTAFVTYVIENNPVLTDMTVLNNLVAVPHYLKINTNTSLSDFSPLNNLTSVNLYIEIEGNAVSDISPLSALSTVGSNFSLKDNENLDDCCLLLPILTTAGAIGGTITIENNDENCSSLVGITNWCTDVDNDGITGQDGDCAFLDGTIFPGATEICDGIDNNCDGQTDEGLQVTCYQDADMDGYGNPDVTILACSCEGGYVADNTDCDDGDDAINPAATEICDGIDNNCDGQTDEGVQMTCYQDADMDGYGNPDVTILACSCEGGYIADNTDCDDGDDAINPAATEVCDGVDNNCDGQTDEGVQVTCYEDADADGYGNPDVTILACSCEGGYVADNTDCNDNSEISYPGAVDICDGLDNNCDGEIDENGICYCESYGESTAYEWIESIDVNGTTNASGDDGGYANYTADLVLPLSTGYNSLQLDPGFSNGNYREYWSVWIDLNQDDDFDDYGELVYYASSFYSIYGDIYIPASAMTGTTRMRISMRYGYWSSPCSIFAEGEVEDYLVDISFCDNITNGGEIGEDEILCDGTTNPATIYSIADADGGSGDMEYIWLMSTTTAIPPNYYNMNEWTEIPNSNVTSYTPDAISQTTWYIRCARRNGCIEYTGESNVIEKTYLNGNCIPDHCTSEGLSTDYEWIQKVVIGSINNYSGDDGGYGDYTNLSTDLWVGENLNITLKPGFSGSSYLEYWRVWIDWNQDGDFEDGGELEVQTKGYGTRYMHISVPADAMLGNTRMRVSMKYGAYPTACEVFAEGEVEDYTITVLDNSEAIVVQDPGEKDVQMERDEEETAEISRELNVYPNPAIDQLFINLEDHQGEDVTIELRNGLGQLLQVKEIATVSNTIVELPVSGLQHGYYLLSIHVAGEETITKQVIIGR